MAWFEASRVQGVVIGGVAASLLGRPRATRDVDVLVLVDEALWEEFLEAGARFDFQPRRPDALSFARRSRVLLVRHQVGGLDVDVVFGALPFERQVIAGAGSVQLGDVSVAVPSPEDLVIMKAVARRARDLADIEAILDAHPTIDVERVRRWVREFSDALETPEMLADLENILARRRVG